MRAAVLEEFGPPGVHTIATTPVPVPLPGQVLVRVAACGVCGEDALARRGDLPHFGSRVPLVQGHELTGRVVGTGSNEERGLLGKHIVVGQSSSCHTCGACRSGHELLCERSTIYGQDRPGGYAEYVVVDAGDAITVPDGLPDEAAALAGCAIGVGVRALRHAGMTAGQTVLVTGASGGVGVHVLQIDRAYGIRAVAVTSSPRKAQELTSYADEVVVGIDDFAAAVRARGLRPDVVIELTAGITFAQSCRAVRRGGQIVVVGNVDTRPLLLHSGAVIAREMVIRGSAGASRSEIEEALRLLGEGSVRPVLAGRYPLHRVAEAHRLQESAAGLGRVVLTC